MACAALFLLSCSMSAKSGENKAPLAETTVEASEQGEVISLDKATFLAKVFNYEKSPSKWVYEGDKPCIIDFYADWCGPCKKLAPVLAELAKEYKGQVIIYKINVEKERELAGAFGIQSIPSILFVPKTGQPQMAQGALPKEEFVKAIDGFLLGKK